MTRTENYTRGLVSKLSLTGLLFFCPSALVLSVDSSIKAFGGRTGQHEMDISQLWGGSAWGHECIINAGAGAGCTPTAGNNPGGTACGVNSLDFNFCTGGQSSETCHARVLALYCDDETNPVETCPHTGYACVSGIWTAMGDGLVANSAACGTFANCD